MLQEYSVERPYNTLGVLPRAQHPSRDFYYRLFPRQLYRLTIGGRREYFLFPYDREVSSLLSSPQLRILVTRYVRIIIRLLAKPSHLYQREKLQPGLSFLTVLEYLSYSRILPLGGQQRVHEPFKHRTIMLVAPSRSSLGRISYLSDK